ncbi:MAG: cob(I)yrinic acid a,c-diamide adenosyltransferase [Bacteroidales bacterium]|nr:cob(I)yrinic acid a,c-diamide adenosyltransferase [Bacteroidales bacterium]
MIYTGTGDGGTTTLIGGICVDKDNVRVEAYGAVDELNAHLGLLAEISKSLDAESFPFLKKVQRNLFVVQTSLSCPDDLERKPVHHLDAECISTLEREIDRLEGMLPVLRSFVVPGGCMAAAQAHVARTVCRRAERRIVSLSHSNTVSKEILQYVNRLSDYLFVLSRYFVWLSNAADDCVLVG